MKLSEFKKNIYKKCDSRISHRDKLTADIASQVFEARLKRGLTQKKLANLIGTKQPSIARLEAGNLLPNLKFLNKIAEALNTELIAPKFAFIDKKVVAVFNNIQYQGVHNLNEFIRNTESISKDILFDGQTDHNNKTVSLIATHKY